MAEQVGVIEYEVRAETAHAIASSKQMDVALSQIEKGAKTADAGMKRLNTTMTATATSVKAATSNFTMMKGGITGIGQQIQDIAVQAAMGTKELIILGQQGPQIASYFGPGGAMVGAVIAVGAAILGLAGAADTAGESIDELAKKADSLGQAQIEDAINKANIELAKEQRALIKVTEEADRLERGQKALGLTTGIYAVKLTELKAEQEAQSDVVNQLIGNIDRLTASLNGSVDAAEKSRQATKEIVSDLQFETAALSLNEAQRAAAIAQRRAGVDAASEEGKAIELAAIAYVNEKQSIEAADKAKREAEANSKKAATQAESEQKRLEAQYTANENSLKRMAQQLTIAGLSTQGLARDAAQLAAAYSLGETATEAQIEQARQLAGALFDVNEQKRTQKEIDSRNKELKQKFDPIGSTSDKYAEESAMLLEARQKDLITEQTFQMQKNAIATQYEQQRLAAAEELYRAQSEGNAFVMDSVNALGQASTSTISGLLSGTMSATEAMQNFANIILNQAVGALVGMGIEYVKQQLLQQTLAASTSSAQIGLATTTGSAIASAYAPAAAMASLASFGGNAIPAQAALTTTTGLAAGLASAGGRQYGGPVNPGSMYRVGEGNAPELFSSGGSSYMIPGSRGQVTPMDSASSGVTFNITNQASDLVQTQQSYDPETRTVELAITAVANQINSRTGRVGAAMKGAGAYNRLG